MVRRNGGTRRSVRVWLWLVVAAVVVAGVRGVEAQVVGGEDLSFPAVPKVNLSAYEQQIQRAVYEAFASASPSYATGENFTTSLAGELANVTLQAVRLRVGSLRRHGVTLGRFTIPPGLRITNISAVRVILVYRDFGNVSVFSDVPGQVFVSSLAGIRVYNGDTVTPTSPLPALTAIAFENPIQVIIPPNAQPSYCVEFSGNGTAFATNATSASNSSSGTTPTYACFSKTLGENYFALVGLPLPGKKSKTWKIILGVVLGVLGLLLLMLCLLCCCRRQLRKRKIKHMQESADKGETLQPTVVGNSRAPVATQTRTRPRLERDLNVT